MAIGLDIGSSAVRVAELDRRSRGKPRLVRFGERPLPLGAVVDGDVVEPEVVTQSLRQLWSDAGIKGRDVAVGLASQRVTVRQMELPELPESELHDALRLQAEDQLPMPVEQALLDYVVVGRSAAGEDPRKLQVLLVAAEREMVERLLAAVTAAKLRPVLVDLDAFALLRSLADTRGPDGDTAMIVDVGAAVTKIAVHRGGEPLFVRMVRLGGEAATRQLQTVLELSWEEAEKAKLDASGASAGGAELDPDDERARVLHASVQRVVTEVRHSLDFFRSQHDNVEVRHIVLSGGGSLAPNLPEALHAALELPICREDPLGAVDGGSAKSRPGEVGPRCLGVPVGLAMGLLS